MSSQLRDSAHMDAYAHVPVFKGKRNSEHNSASTRNSDPACFVENGSNLSSLKIVEFSPILTFKKCNCQDMFALIV